MAEASRLFYLPPAECEYWVNPDIVRKENTLRAKPADGPEHHDSDIKKLGEAHGQAMLELRARAKLDVLLCRDEN
jgi:hypothetical protein